VDVYLYRNVNGNGEVDAGDTLLATDTTNAIRQLQGVPVLPDGRLILDDTLSCRIMQSEKTVF
jgi:hypothetical protein